MTERPVLNQLNVVVSDMDAALAFYEKLGLTAEETNQEWQQHHRTITIPGGIDLELDSAQSMAIWNPGWPAGRPGGVIGFTVDSREQVDQLCEELAASGTKVQQPPYDAFWGSRYAVVEDPDGNAIGLMSPPDPTRRFGPPNP